MSDKYEAEIRCLNCGYKNKRNIPKDVSIGEYLNASDRLDIDEGEEKCDKCECNIRERR